MVDMSYAVLVTRDGDNWLADVPSVPGAHSFARSLEGHARSVREVVVLMDDLPDDAAVELDFHFEVADESVIEAERLRRIRKDIHRAESELVAATARLVGDLSKSYSVRDTAAMLGVTAGRVSQMENVNS
jgi:hypothetical protein